MTPRAIIARYCVVGFATVAVVPLLLVLRARHERADAIVGRKTGLRSSCAAAGIPAISQVSAERG